MPNRSPNYHHWHRDLSKAFAGIPPTAGFDAAAAAHYCAVIFAAWGVPAHQNAADWRSTATAEAVVAALEALTVAQIQARPPRAMQGFVQQWILRRLRGVHKHAGIHGQHCHGAPPDLPERPDATPHWLECAEVSQAMLQLAPADRQLLEDLYIRQLRQCDIAAREGITQPAVSKRLHGALAALRTALEQLGKNDEIFDFSGYKIGPSGS